MTDSPVTGSNRSSIGHIKTRALFAAKLAISLSLMAYLFSLVDFPSLRQDFADLILIYIAVAVLLLLCQSFLSAFKWRTLLAADGVRLNYLYLLRTYLISNFVSLFLPTSFGGDIYRVMAVRKAAMSTAKTASSVLFDRLTGLFALLSLACAGYLTYPGLPFKWLVALGYVGGLVIFWLGTSGWILARIGPAESSLLQKLIKILESFHTYARNRRCLLTALAVSFVFQLNIIVINKVYSLAFGLEVPFTVLLTIIPLVYLTEMIPLSINGLGFREGAFVFFYELIGQPPGAGFAVSLLVLAMRYTIGLVGGILLAASLIFGNRRDSEPDNEGTR